MAKKDRGESVITNVVTSKPQIETEDMGAAPVIVDSQPDVIAPPKEKTNKIEIGSLVTITSSSIKSIIGKTGTVKGANEIGFIIDVDKSEYLFLAENLAKA